MPNEVSAIGPRESVVFEGYVNLDTLLHYILNDAEEPTFPPVSNG